MLFDTLFLASFAFGADLVSSAGYDERLVAFRVYVGGGDLEGDFEVLPAAAAAVFGLFF